MIAFARDDTVEFLKIGVLSGFHPQTIPKKIKKFVFMTPNHLGKCIIIIYCPSF
jgi:hypothetical protein